MPTYMSYGYQVAETVLDSVAQKRIIFAISMSNNPAWLAWYVYVEKVNFGAKERALEGSNTPANQGWEKINVLTEPRAQGGPIPFSINAKLDANEFTGGKGFFKYPVVATLTLVVAKSGVHANIRIPVKSQTADLLLAFKNATDQIIDDSSPRPGKIWLLGSTKFNASALNAGPVSTQEAGNHTPFDRVM